MEGRFVLKRIISGVLVVVLLFFCPMTLAQAKSGSSYTDQTDLAKKLDELFLLYPDGTYFTYDGKAHKNDCPGNDCKYCQLSTIVTNNTDVRKLSSPINGKNDSRKCHECAW